MKIPFTKEQKRRANEVDLVEEQTFQEAEMTMCQQF